MNKNNNLVFGSRNFLDENAIVEFLPGEETRLLSDSVSIGTRNSMFGDAGVVVGSHSSVYGARGVAIGSFCAANAEGAVVIGCSEARQDGEGAVLLGGDHGYSSIPKAVSVSVNAVSPYGADTLASSGTFLHRCGEKSVFLYPIEDMAIDLVDIKIIARIGGYSHMAKVSIAIENGKLSVLENILFNKEDAELFDIAIEPVDKSKKELTVKIKESCGMGSYISVTASINRLLVNTEEPYCSDAQF